MEKYKDYSTAYINSIRVKTGSGNLNKSLDEHSLRLMNSPEELEHFDQTKEINNQYYVLNNETGELELMTFERKQNESAKDYYLRRVEQRQKISDFIQDDIKNNRKIWKNSTLAETENAKGETVKISHSKQTQLIKDRTQIKRKIKNWADTEKNEKKKKKATSEELNFWNEVYSNIGNNEIDPDELLAQLDCFDNVSRYNDKTKAINKLKDFNCLLGAERRNKRFVESAEYMIKIPDDNHILWEPDHQKQFLETLLKEMLPDHKIYYIAIHLDENEQNPHIHAKVSGFNEKTKKYDLVDSELQYLEKYKKSLKATHKINKTKNKDLHNDQVKRNAQQFQTMLFNKLNEHFNKIKDPVFDDHPEFKKRPKSERAKNDEEFKDNKKPIRKRANNGVNKAKEQEELAKKKQKRAEKKANLAEIKKSNAIHKRNEVKKEYEETLGVLKRLKKLIVELPVKVCNAILAVKDSYDMPNNENVARRTDRLEELSNHLDEIEEIDQDNDFDANEETVKIIKAVETDHQTQQNFVDRFNNFENNLKDPEPDKPNKKPRSLTL